MRSKALKRLCYELPMSADSGTGPAYLLTNCSHHGVNCANRNFRWRSWKLPQYMITQQLATPDFQLRQRAHMAQLTAPKNITVMINLPIFTCAVVRANA